MSNVLPESTAALPAMDGAPDAAADAVVDASPHKPGDERRCRRRAARRRKRRDTAAVSAFLYDLRASATRA